MKDKVGVGGAGSGGGACAQLEKKWLTTGAAVSQLV